MRSNVCKIEKGTQDQAAIFMECEKVASYNGLDHKQALQLRLLCEEIDGMLPWLIEDFEGKLWIGKMVNGQDIKIFTIYLFINFRALIHWSLIHTQKESE